MTRLHDMFYGPLPVRTERTDQRDSSMQEVAIRSPAIRALMTQLRCTGQWRTGLLFGTMEKGTLNVSFVALATTPGRRVSDGLPLAIDDDYALGWADALTATHAGEFDWQGMWLIAPNSQLPNPLDQLRWIEQAAQWGLLTEDLTLMFIGWQQGRLSSNAYVQRDEPTSILVRFEDDGD